MEERLEGMRAKPAEAPKLTFEPTGDTKKTKHGFSCKPHRVLANGKPIEEACFIPWKEAGLSVDDFRAFDALDQFFRKLGTQGGISRIKFSETSPNPPASPPMSR
ncbi:MAG: hypothetical protein MPW17_00235 [Candidatus Manganitrophus sp.]|nr:hypothetical protein [Candidatus Manganitrophus sp.]WDT71325.1 MAG: hypothetical protein MPW17_00235 [Candidatus Manganitrophus sp.]